MATASAVAASSSCRVCSLTVVMQPFLGYRTFNLQDLQAATGTCWCALLKGGGCMCAFGFLGRGALGFDKRCNC